MRFEATWIVAVDRTGSHEIELPFAGARLERMTIDGEPLPGPKNCLPVPAKKPPTIVIEATPASRAAGTVSGTVEVFEKVQGADETTTQIPFRFDMARGVDEAGRGHSEARQIVDRTVRSILI